MWLCGFGLCYILGLQGSYICCIYIYKYIYIYAVATEPALERNMTSLESRHRITCVHNRVAIVFRREPVVRVPRIAIKRPGMCKLSKVSVHAIVM